MTTHSKRNKKDLKTQPHSSPSQTPLRTSTQAPRSLTQPPIELHNLSSHPSAQFSSTHSAPLRSLPFRETKESQGTSHPFHGYTPPSNEDSESFEYQEPFFREGWSIRRRLGVFLIGIVAYIASERTPGRIRFLLKGFAWASWIRSIFNLHVTPFLGRLFNPSMTLRREITINAPIEHVFSFLRTFSNYPRFMSFVKKVEVNDQGDLTWTLNGPMNLGITFEAHLLQLIPHQKMSWISSTSSVIKNSGSITFREKPNSKTHLCIELSYAPPLGILGYVLLLVFGYNPKSRIQSDLIQLKKLLEESSPPSFLIEDEAAIL